MPIARRHYHRSHPGVPVLRLIVGLLFLFVHGGLAHAATALEQWRGEVARVRLLAQNDVPRAYEEAQRLRDTLPAGALPTDQVKVLNLLARIETYLTLTDAAAASAEQALELAQRLGDRIGQAEANLSIAINAVNQGRLDAVNEAAIQAMTLLDGANRPELLAEAMLRTAMMYRRSGQIEESVTMSMQTLDIARRSGNALALTYGHQGLAISYDQSDHPDEARQHYAQMRDQARAAGSKMLEGSALLGLGGGYGALGDARQAEQMLRESIAIQRMVGAPTWLTSALYALAEHWRREKRYAEAQKLFDEIIAIHERGKNRLGLWWGHVGRGANHESLGHLAGAHADAERAYALAKEIGQPYYLSESAKRLAILIAADGDYRNAYRYSREAIKITTRDAREKAAGRMLELSRRYQSESRQRQIDELNRVNERQAANQRWLWTVFAATLALLVLTACFLLRQRRTNRQLALLNQQLQQSGNKLQATLDAIPDLLFELGLDGRYYDCHSPHSELPAEPMADQLGRTTAEPSPETRTSCTAALADLIGQTVAETLPPEAAASCMAALAEAHETGSSTGRQIALELATGTRFFELSVARKITAAGREARFIVLSRDITQRQRAEAALAASEREFRSLAKNLPDNICRHDPQGRMSYLNPRLEATLNMDTGQLLGKTVLEAFPDGRFDDYDQQLQAVLATGEENEIELELPVFGHGIRHHHIRFVAERDLEGRIVGILAIGRDITELREKERQIEESRDLLRELAEYRDSAREEERKRIAREIHDELGQMLTAQRLDIATLKFQFGMDNPALGERCRHLLEITDQTIRSVRTIASALRPAALDMGIASALEWLTEEFSQRTGVVFRLQLGQSGLELDENQSITVFRVVQESLTNVARYAEARQVEIVLENTGDGHHLSIRDDGKGFDPQDIRPRSFGLLGIRERALMLGGEAHFTSVPGQGTAVSIRFPANRKTKAAS